MICWQSTTFSYKKPSFFSVIAKWSTSFPFISLHFTHPFFLFYTPKFRQTHKHRQGKVIVKQFEWSTIETVQLFNWLGWVKEDKRHDRAIAPDLTFSFACALPLSSARFLKYNKNETRTLPLSVCTTPSQSLQPLNMAVRLVIVKLVQ